MTTSTKFRWDFGDGTPFHDTNEPTAKHHYKKAGDYAVRIVATDDLGHSDRQEHGPHHGLTKSVAGLGCSRSRPRFS
jgi:hypothetical protein